MSCVCSFQVVPGAALLRFSSQLCSLTSCWHLKHLHRGDWSLLQTRPFHARELGRCIPHTAASPHPCSTQMGAILPPRVWGCPSNTAQTCALDSSLGTPLCHGSSLAARLCQLPAPRALSPSTGLLVCPPHTVLSRHPPTPTPASSPGCEGPVGPASSVRFTDPPRSCQTDRCPSLL